MSEDNQEILIKSIRLACKKLEIDVIQALIDYFEQDKQELEKLKKIQDDFKKKEKTWDEKWQAEHILKNEG